MRKRIDKDRNILHIKQINNLGKQNSPCFGQIYRFSGSSFFWVPFLFSSCSWNLLHSICSSHKCLGQKGNKLNPSQSTNFSVLTDLFHVEQLQLAVACTQVLLDARHALQQLRVDVQTRGHQLVYESSQSLLTVLHPPNCPYYLYENATLYARLTRAVVQKGSLRCYFIG